MHEFPEERVARTALGMLLIAGNLDDTQMRIVLSGLRGTRPGNMLTKRSARALQVLAELHGISCYVRCWHFDVGWFVIRNSDFERVLPDHLIESLKPDGRWESALLGALRSIAFSYLDQPEEAVKETLAAAKIIEALIGGGTRLASLIKLLGDIDGSPATTILVEVERQLTTLHSR